MSETDLGESGTLDVHDGMAVVRFERHYPVTPERFWDAWTTPEQLALWFPSTIEGTWQDGASLSFHFPQQDAQPMGGTLIHWTPSERVELDWGDERLVCAVVGDNGSVTMTFSAAFAELGKAARDGAGWHAALDALGSVLAGTVPPMSTADRWQQVIGLYQERFGARASTIGPPTEWEAVHRPATSGS